MNYEQKYKEALAWVESIYPELNHEHQMEAETFFPELRESLDEKIRKRIILCLEECVHDDIIRDYEKDECLAWLEKLKVFSEHGDGLYYFGNNGFTYVCNPIWDNVSWLEKQVDKDKFIEKELGCIRGYREKAIKRLEELEKQGEQQPYGQMEECADCQFNYAGECKGSCTMKKSEPNLTDNAEPKFHEGDWIIWDNKVICYIDSVHQGKETFMYTIVDTNGMIRSYGVKGFEKNARLWTLQDAKPGDVLIDHCDDYKNPLIFILKKFERVDFGLAQKSDYSSYCFLTSGDRQRFKEGTYHHKHNIKPAAKEQREILFQKMHEAGYMWDSKSKQLLSLKAEPSGKQKPAGWSEEDEGFLNLLLAIFTNEHPNGVFTTGNITVFKGDCVTSSKIINWIKSLKDKVQQKPAKWSEEDVQTLDRIISNYQYFCMELALKEKLTDVERTVIGNVNKEDVDWLKSLRPQNHSNEPSCFWSESQRTDYDIEYVRKDAFIDKACKWLRKGGSGWYLYSESGEEDIDFVKLAEDFRKAMEE